MPCTILILKVNGVGPVPLLIDEGGKVNRDVLAWFVMEKQDHLKASNTLHGYATALAKFTDYWKFHQETAEVKPIFSAFFEALVHGEPEIGWHVGVSTDTASRYLETLCLFLDWHIEETGGDHEHPNPKVERPLSWGERVNQYRRRFKNDLLFHLASSNKGSHVKNVRLINPAHRAKRGSSGGGRRPNRKFSMEDYLLLIKHERDPRNLLMWLALGAAGLRVSEPPTCLLTTSCLILPLARHALSLLTRPTEGYR